MTNKQALKIFKENNIRYSATRIEIFKIFKANQNSSMKELHEKVKEKQYNISLTTIYNAMKVFTKHKL